MRNPLPIALLLLVPLAPAQDVVRQPIRQWVTGRVQRADGSPWDSVRVTLLSNLRRRDHRDRERAFWRDRSDMRLLARAPAQSTLVRFREELEELPFMRTEDRVARAYTDFQGRMRILARPGRTVILLVGPEPEVAEPDAAIPIAVDAPERGDASVPVRVEVGGRAADRILGHYGVWVLHCGNAVRRTHARRPGSHLGTFPQ